MGQVGIKAENDRAKVRRDTMGVERPNGQEAPWALCLSGGGIRSATFCLGVLQGLAQVHPPTSALLAGPATEPADNSAKQPEAHQSLLGQFDFLSTVSGGGYIGAFFSSLFVRGRLSGPDAPPQTDKAVAEQAYKALRAEPPNRMYGDTAYQPAQPGAAALAWLRDNGRYLAPGGAGDFVYAASITVRNWFATQYVLATVILTALALSLGVRLFATQIPGYSVLGAWLYPDCDGLVWWSSTWLVVVVLLSVSAIPLGIGFWFTHPAKGKSLTDPPRVCTYAAAVALVLGATGVALGFWGLAQNGWTPTAWTAGWTTIWADVLLFGGLVTCLGLIYFAATARICPPPTITAHRVRMTQALSLALQCTGAVAVLATIETLAQTAATFMHSQHLAPASAAAAAAIWLTRFVATHLPEKAGGGALKKLPLSSLAGIAGIVLWLFVAVLHELFLLWIVAGGNPVSDASFLINKAACETLQIAGGAFLVLLVLTLASGRFPGFLNLSTLQGLYSARLTRTFLGASNFNRFQPNRLRPGKHDGRKKRSVAQPDSGDGLAIDKLHANPFAPVHYINVCMNQTVGPDAQLVQRDRKGKPLTVAPGGFYLDGQHRPFPAANTGGDMASVLDTGEWAGVSGAAFTTGLGRSTNLGYSLLLGFANVRLGRWWSSGVGDGEGGAASQDSLLRSMFRPQSYLIDEILGQFQGTHRACQYLSDGGHFENTAAYEMLRHERQVALLLVCDCGADPDYQFEDLANLIRLARIDHGVEIKVSSHSNAKCLNPAFGSPEDFRPAANGGQPPGPRPCAILLDVCETSRPTEDNPSPVPGRVKARIVLIKPRVIADLPADILNYHATHPAFPQESTGDQFFDEAQWESYRKLGLEITGRVFPKVGPDTGYSQFWKTVLDGLARPVAVT